MQATKVVTGKDFPTSMYFTQRRLTTARTRSTGFAYHPKIRQDTLAKCEAAIRRDGDGRAKGGKIPRVETPLRDGARRGRQACAGCMFSAWPEPSPPINKNRQQITDEEECTRLPRQGLDQPLPVDASGNRGVAAGLNNLLKLEDGELLAADNPQRTTSRLPRGEEDVQCC